MIRETTDTNDSYPDKDIPDGTYTFKILDISKKFGGVNKDKPFFVFKLEFEGVRGEQVLMPNMMGDLLRLLGATEIKPGVFEYDLVALAQSGKRFVATVIHVADKKDPSKMRQQMGDFKKAEEELEF